MSHEHPSGGPLGLTVPEARRQHPEPRDQDPLRLLLALDYNLRIGLPGMSTMESRR